MTPIEMKLLEVLYDIFMNGIKKLYNNKINISLGLHPSNNKAQRKEVKPSKTPTQKPLWTKPKLKKPLGCQ